jgi:hypothetical protein
MEFFVILAFLLSLPLLAVTSPVQVQQKKRLPVKADDGGVTDGLEAWTMIRKRWGGSISPDLEEAITNERKRGKSYPNILFSYLLTRCSTARRKDKDGDAQSSAGCLLHD